MQLWPRIRGLLGSALIWSTVGASIGTAMFLVRFQPWRSSMNWSQLLIRFAAFAGSGVLWGSVCGLAFGAVIWRVSTRRSTPLSARQLTVWGAIGGAAFPLLLYTPLVISRGAYGSVPFYGMLTGISACIGALCGRAIFSLATRAPASSDAPVLLGASPLDLDIEMVVNTGERVR